MDLEFIKKVFDEYVNTFDMNNYDTSYKYRHSYRVYEISEKIAKKMSLSNEDILLASVIGLLHDIGRFEQLKDYSSYNDSNLDHAEFGAKLLFEDGLIEKFKIDSKYYDIIKFAIRNHNKYSIEPTRDKKKKMFAEIIRDADKLDIFRAYTIYDDYTLPEDNKQIFNKVESSFYNNKQIAFCDLKSKNDEIILALAMLFDINNDFILKIVKKDKLIEKFYDKIENKELFKPYFNYMVQFLCEG